MGRYDDYIASPEWASRRGRYWSTHVQACAACGSTERVALHHVEYDRALFGFEPDDHLLPLCHEHHMGVHELHAAQAAHLTLREATAQYVASLGGSAPSAGEGKPEPRNHERWESQVRAVCPVCAAPVGEPCVRVVHGRRQTIRQVHGKRKAASNRVR